MNIQAISKKKTRWFVAEFIGTSLLTATLGVVVVGSDLYPSVFQALYIPFIVGAVVTALVYLFGPFSGAHFNPAISIALWVVRKIKSDQLAVYLVSQVLGALAGTYLVQFLMGAKPHMVFSMKSSAIGAEFIGAFLLVLVVTSVVLGTIEREVSGITIGIGLAVGVTISTVASGGFLNPAIALAFGAVHIPFIFNAALSGIIPYLVAPVLGGIAAASLGMWLHEEEYTLGQAEV